MAEHFILDINIQRRISLVRTSVRKINQLEKNLLKSLQ